MRNRYVVIGHSFFMFLGTTIDLANAWPGRSSGSSSSWMKPCPGIFKGSKFVLVFLPNYHQHYLRLCLDHRLDVKLELPRLWQRLCQKTPSPLQPCDHQPMIEWQLFPHLFLLDWRRLQPCFALLAWSSGLFCHLLLLHREDQEAWALCGRECWKLKRLNYWLKSVLNLVKLKSVLNLVKLKSVLTLVKLKYVLNLV